MKNCGKCKFSCPKYWDVNNLHDSAMSQKLLVNSFKFVKDDSEFDESFKKVIMKKFFFFFFFFEVDTQYLENLHKLHNHLPFLTEIMIIEKLRNL